MSKHAPPYPNAATDPFNQVPGMNRPPMTAETDLLPCPFCGSADAPRLKNTHTASFWVSCSEEYGGCGAQASGQFFPGPSRRTRFCYDPEAPEGSTFYARTLGELHPEYRRSAKSAIAAWNRHANVAHATATLQAALEAAREDAERYRWLRDREIPEWLDLWHQNPDRIDAAIDRAMKEQA